MGDPPAAAVRKTCCVCDAPGGQHCTKCKSRHYCSKNCQLIDWKEGGHKAQCKRLAAKFQDRTLDAIMPEKKVKEQPPIVDDVAPAAGSNAAARLLAGRATATAKATVLDEGKSDWRGACAICLDLLPIEAVDQTFYECCCKSICTACSVKCRQHDERCPLCRTPASKSDSEWVRRVQENVDKGHDEALIILGDAYLMGDMGLKRSLKRAFQLYQLAVAQGNAVSQYKLGKCYSCGNGVKIDYKAAGQWYQRAADQGFPAAQFNLGLIFYNGKGVAQSYDEAVRWYRLAGAQGHAAALFNLAACHANGHGVPRAFDEALRFFKRAAAKGQAGAAQAVEKLEESLAAPPALTDRNIDCISF